MRNHDEAVLRARRVDPAAPFAPPHQVLRIALYDAYAARAFYAKVSEAFGPKAPFAEALQARERHIALLAGLCARLGIPRPLDPFPMETSVAPSWLANCQRALAGEADTARLDERLWPYATFPEIGKALRRLQADALRRQVPAFRQALARAIEREELHAAQGIGPDEAYMEHGFFSDFLEKTFAVLGSQHQAFGVVGPLLRNTRPAMLAGLLAGGVGAYLVKHQRHPKRKEK